MNTFIQITNKQGKGNGKMIINTSSIACVFNNEEDGIAVIELINGILITTSESYEVVSGLIGNVKAHNPSKGNSLNEW